MQKDNEFSLGQAAFGGLDILSTAKKQGRMALGKEAERVPK